MGPRGLTHIFVSLSGQPPPGKAMGHLMCILFVIRCRQKLAVRKQNRIAWRMVDAICVTRWTNFGMRVTSLELLTRSISITTGKCNHLLYTYSTYMYMCAT